MYPVIAVYQIKPWFRYVRNLYYMTVIKTMIILWSLHRAGKAAVPFLCGRQVMVGGVEITAHVTATPTAFTPSP